MAEIPVFQFAIFYNALLEFSDCAPMTINGRVHCNTNIYVGCLPAPSLTFNYMVTCSGTHHQSGLGWLCAKLLDGGHHLQWHSLAGLWHR